MHSCLYVGQVNHRRHGGGDDPVSNAFTYRLFMVYLDLAELDTVFRGRWLWSARRRAPAWLRREDHLGDPAVKADVRLEHVDGVRRQGLGDEVVLRLAIERE